MPLLTGAAQFARQALRLEQSTSPPVPTAPTVFEHRASVLAALMMAAASLEASINEVCSDANESDGGLIASIDHDARAVLAEMWAKGVPRTARYSILEKYEITLTLLRKPQIDRSRNSYRDAKLLTQLRNTFLHFEPTWQAHDMMRSNDPNEVHQFEKALRGRFTENPLTGAGNPFYPDKLLGHGCAAWAVESAVAFSDAFFANLGVRPPHENYRELLATA